MERERFINVLGWYHLRSCKIQVIGRNKPYQISMFKNVKFGKNCIYYKIITINDMSFEPWPVFDQFFLLGFIWLQNIPSICYNEIMTFSDFYLIFGNRCNFSKFFIPMVLEYKKSTEIRIEFQIIFCRLKMFCFGQLVCKIWTETSRWF